MVPTLDTDTLYTDLIREAYDQILLAYPSKVKTTRILS
jgi:hypothetical protein